jgi:SAM-dependent methyltransferase
MIDIREHNREAWNNAVRKGNEWTIPVGPEVTAKAKKGIWHIVLTPTKPVPEDWFPPLKGLDVLCLASGGGQQGPVLAAAGANVTVLDNSPLQLQQDGLVAERDGLVIRTVEGDMRNLSMFKDESFGLIVHPVSNTFVPDVRPVWREAFRVLRKGGVLLSGFTNPALYLFDFDLAEKTGILQVKYSIPYSDQQHPEEMAKLLAHSEPIEHSHTLEDQIGGQIDAGFVIAGFYEDVQPFREGGVNIPMSTYIATRAEKP